MPQRYIQSRPAETRKKARGESVHTSLRFEPQGTGELLMYLDLQMPRGWIKTATQHFYSDLES